MTHREAATPSIRQATASERASALEVVLSAQSAPQRAEQIVEWLEEAKSCDTLDGLWIAEADQRIVGAALGRRLPGQSATVWPAQVTQADSQSTLEGQLLSTVVAWLGEQNARSAQALLPAESGPEHDQLIAGGFVRVADLLFQVCFLDKRSGVPAATRESREDLRFVAYAPQFRSRLAGILQGTYQGSLDCPVLDGVRELNDVMEGYAAHGDSGTAHWYLVECAGVDAGCLLLAHDRRLGYSELVYMGLLPLARGAGLGRELVHYAQQIARSEGLLRMSLAVDAGNLPAIAAYERMGFITWEKKTAYFRHIKPRAAGEDAP